MKLLSLWVAIGLVAASQAQVASFCAADDVCYKVNVPEASASSGDGDLYFQIQGPSSMQWIGLGQGGSMTGSNIFIIYADTSGSNITLSPRLGKGDRQPNFDTQAQVSLLGGSGIANGKMTANVRCSNCASWDGGSMDFTSSKTNWIWAFKSGSALSTNSQSANLQQHSNYDSFNFDLTQARGGNSLNPFESTSATATTAATASPSASSSSSSSSDSSSGSQGTQGDGAASGSFSAESSIAANFAKRHKAVIAHGILMGLAFALLFPTGSFLIRLLSFRGLVWVHAAFQMFTYAIALAGLGLGVYISVWPSEVSEANLIGTYHPVLGLVVIGLLLFQPVLGLIHHFIYKARHLRTFWATAHVWYGRVVITAGIINGGLGFKLRGSSAKGKVAYGVIAGVMWCIWMVVIIASYYKRSTKQDYGERTAEKGVRRLNGDGGSDSDGSKESRYWQEVERSGRTGMNRSQA